MAGLYDPKTYYEAFLIAYDYLKNAADGITLDLLREDEDGFLHYSAYEQARENKAQADGATFPFPDFWDITEDKTMSNAMAMLSWQLIKLESDAGFNGFPSKWENLTGTQVTVHLVRLSEDVPKLDWQYEQKRAELMRLGRTEQPEVEAAALRLAIEANPALKEWELENIKQDAWSLHEAKKRDLLPEVDLLGLCLLRLVKRMRRLVELASRKEVDDDSVRQIEQLIRAAENHDQQGTHGVSAAALTADDFADSDQDLSGTDFDEQDEDEEAPRSDESQSIAHPGDPDVEEVTAELKSKGVGETRNSEDDSGPEKDHKGSRVEADGRESDEKQP